MVLEVLTSRHSSASSCYKFPQIIHISFYHPNIILLKLFPAPPVSLIKPRISQRAALIPEEQRHQLAKWHMQSDWPNSQASEASWPASSCLLTAGKAKSNELLLEQHLWLSLGCCYAKKKKNSFEDSMQPVGHVLCRPALLLVRKGENRKYTLW